MVKVIKRDKHGRRGNIGKPANPYLGWSEYVPPVLDWPQTLTLREVRDCFGARIHNPRSDF